MIWLRLTKFEYSAHAEQCRATDPIMINLDQVFSIERNEHKEVDQTTGERPKWTVVVAPTIANEGEYCCEHVAESLEEITQLMLKAGNQIAGL